MVLEQLGINMHKRERENLNTDVTSFTKINSKSVIKLNVKHNTIKFGHNTKCLQGCGTTETLISCWWECKMVQKTV